MFKSHDIGAWRAKARDFTRDESGTTAIEYGGMAAMVGLTAIGAADLVTQNGASAGLAPIKDALSGAEPPAVGGHTFTR